MKIDIKKGFAAERAASYPSIEDQLDMLFHGGLDAWREAIRDVKDRIPKPEERPLLPFD